MTRRDDVGASAGVRISLVFFGVLALGALIVTYLLAESTDRHFAWTIRPPITAAFLGAGYSAGLIAVLTAGWRGRWAETRLWTMSFFVFSVVTAAATFMHLDRFHLDSTGLPLVAAGAWIAVYIILPIWTLVLLVAIRRDHGTPARPTWPTALVVVLWVQAVVQATVGVLLFVAPESASWLWPWELTPLTARAVAGWLLASATLAGLMAWERGPARITVCAAAYLTLPAVLAAALPRFGDQVEWGSTAAVIFVIMLVVVTASGLLALRRQPTAARRLA